MRLTLEHMTGKRSFKYRLPIKFNELEGRRAIAKLVINKLAPFLLGALRKVRNS